MNYYVAYNVVFAYFNASFVEMDRLSRAEIVELALLIRGKQ